MHAHRLRFAALVAALFSLLTMFARSAAAEPEPAPEADTEVAPAPAPAAHEAVKMKVGIDLDQVNKFELSTGSFHAEFIVSVLCDKEPCKPKFDLKNGKLNGKPETLLDQPLHKKFKMKGEVDGFIDLTEFPFDRHVLLIQLENKADPLQTNLDLDAEHTKIGERVRIAGWNLNPKYEEVVLHDDLEDGQRADYLVFGVEITRPALPSFVKALVPVLIMLFTAAFQLILKPKGAPGRLTASTGSLSALVMFHVSQVNSLPGVSYLTRFDKFMIVTYAVMLVHIALNVIMVRAEEAKEEARSMKTYLIAAGLVPGLAIVLWLLVLLRYI